MLNLKLLSNTELDHNLLTWIKKEKEALKFIIPHIAEVDCRKLYLEYAYPSLRAYLEQRMGYDGGSAQRRIDAARLSHQVPGVVESLDNGEIKLSQVTVLQKSLREAKSQNISKEMKGDLVESIKNKSVNETQVLLAKALNIEIKQAPKVTFQADESVRLEVSLTKPQWEKVKRMRELLSASVPSGEWSEALEYLADKVIHQRDGNRAPQQSNIEGQVNTKGKPPPLSLYKLKKIVLMRDQCCQFKTENGQTCNSRWGLQVDHIQPKWAGGRDTLENLRALCASHNRYVYRRQAGIRNV